MMDVSLIASFGSQEDPRFWRLLSLPARRRHGISDSNGANIFQGGPAESSPYRSGLQVRS